MVGLQAFLRVMAILFGSLALHMDVVSYGMRHACHSLKYGVRPAPRVHRRIALATDLKTQILHHGHETIYTGTNLGMIIGELMNLASSDNEHPLCPLFKEKIPQLWASPTSRR
jgi:hypothetical protein